MISNGWKNPDGSIDYERYMNSQEWRRFKESYWRRNPFNLCSRCGLSNDDHKRQYGTRLHLHHTTYDTLGFEADDDLEVICKRCHKLEHGGIGYVDFLAGGGRTWSEVSAEGGTDWEEEAFAKIAIRREQVGKSYGPDDPKLWVQLERIAWLEKFVHACQETEPSRLAKCSARAIIEYKTFYREGEFVLRPEASSHLTADEVKQIFADYEENGIVLLDEYGVGEFLNTRFEEPVA